MSYFDADADSLWEEVESVFGDQGTWRSSVHGDTLITVVVDSDYRQIDVRGGESIVDVSIRKADLPGAVSPSDLLEIAQGRYAGKYDNPKIVSDDGYTIVIELRRL